MDRQDILQLFFNTINDSLEWGIGNNNYAVYVDGCAAMTDKLLQKLEEDKVKK